MFKVYNVCDIISLYEAFYNTLLNSGVLNLFFSNNKTGDSISSSHFSSMISK